MGRPFAGECLHDVPFLMGTALNRAGRLAVALLLAASFARGHDHWVLVDAAAGEGGVRGISIGSGHRFPESETLLARRLLADMEIVAPDGRAKPFGPEAHDHAWVASGMFEAPGVWIVSFALRRTPRAEPVHRGRAILVLGKEDDPSRYTKGEGLEIVPLEALSGLSPGDALPLTIMRDGGAIGSTIAVRPENGRSVFITAAADRPALMRVERSGAYLLTVTDRGQTFSLTFRVRDIPGLRMP